MLMLTLLAVTKTPEPSTSSFIVPIIIALLSGGAITAVLTYVKDRRKTRADTFVASETKELRVDAARLENIEKRFSLAIKAWDEERESKDATIASLKARLDDEIMENQRKDGIITNLEAKVEHIKQELQQVTEEIARLREMPAGGK